MADMWVMPKCIRAFLIGAGSRVLMDMPILGKQMRRAAMSLSLIHI